MSVLMYFTLKCNHGAPHTHTHILHGLDLWSLLNEVSLNIHGHGNVENVERCALLEIYV